MNDCKKPVNLLSGPGVIVSEVDKYDHVEYTLHIDDWTIQMVCERHLVNVVAENEELKTRIGKLEARLAALESR